MNDLSVYYYYITCLVRRGLMKFFLLTALSSAIIIPQFISANENESGLVFPPLNNEMSLTSSNINPPVVSTTSNPKPVSAPITPTVHYPSSNRQNMPTYGNSAQQMMPQMPRYPQPSGMPQMPRYPQQMMSQMPRYPQQTRQRPYYPPQRMQQYPNPYSNNPYGYQGQRHSLPPQNQGPKRYWPDFYTGFTEDAWDLMLNGPHDLGVMPGGWEFPSISMPEPIGVSDSLGSQLPIIAEEVPNMFSFSAPKMDMMP